METDRSPHTLAGALPRGPVAIFGGRGGGLVTAEYLMAAGQSDTLLGFLNDELDRGETVGGYDILGRFEDWSMLPPDTRFCAPLHKVKVNAARASRIETLGVPDDRWATIRHPFCAVAQTAKIGRGSSIGAYADIQPGAVIGRHVAVRSKTYLAHDVSVGDFSFIAAGASIGGYSRIGNGAFVGLNAVVLEHLTIGAFAVIGAGSCVARDVQDFEIVAGNPARRIGFVDPFKGAA